MHILNCCLQTHFKKIQKMKTFLCIAILVVSIYAMTDEQKRTLDPLSEECRKTTGVTKEAIDSIRNGIFVDDPKLKAQLVCVQQKLGLITEDGDMIEEKMKERLRKVADDEAEVDKIMTKCFHKKDDKNDAAWSFWKCMTAEKKDVSPID